MFILNYRTGFSINGLHLCLTFRGRLVELSTKNVKGQGRITSIKIANKDAMQFDANVS